VKIDFGQKIKNIDGTIAKEGGKEEDKDMTLGFICANALLANIPNENPSGLDKFKRWELAKKVIGNETVEVTAEDISMMKELVGKAFGVIVVGQTYQMLEKKEG